MRAAHDTGQSAQVRQELNAALSASCILLKDAMADELLADVRARQQLSTDKLFQLDSRGRFEEFLRVERQLLNLTKLEESAVEELIAGARLVVQSRTITSLHEWTDAVGRLQRAVCRTAEAQTSGWIPWLKRSFLSGGGALLVVINLRGFPQIEIPPPVGAISQMLGGMCMTAAGTDVLHQYFGGGV